jgi:hypothetical protein
MVSRAAYQQAGVYRSFFDRLGWEDYDWIYRIAERYKVKNLPEVLYYYRSVSSSVSLTIKDARKLYFDRVAYFLHQQRQEAGADDLMTGARTALDNFIKECDAPYANDPSLVHRIMMTDNLNKPDYGTAWSNLANVFKNAPFKKSSYMALYYYCWKLRQNKRYKK